MVTIIVVAREATGPLAAQVIKQMRGEDLRKHKTFTVGVYD